MAIAELSYLYQSDLQKRFMVHIKFTKSVVPHWASIPHNVKVFVFRTFNLLCRYA